jgi:ribonuclease HI
MKKVTVVTDGACLGNPGPGGWAALLMYGGKERMLTGGEKDTTNNRMELLAVIKGLEALKEPCAVELITDSKYVCDAFLKGWLDQWQDNNWRTASKSPVKNKDLWEDLLSQADRHQITWKWVKGHADHEENNRVDEAARQAAEAQT